MGFAPNRPAGLTTLVDRQFNTTDSVAGAMPPASGTLDSFNQRWAKDSGSPAYTPPLIDTPANLTTAIGATIPALPDGNLTCMAIKYPTGQPIGTTPFILIWNGTAPNWQQSYLACWVCMPSNFNSNGNNIKWFGVSQGAASTNHLMLLSSNGVGTVSQAGASDYRGPWMGLQGGAGNADLGGEGQPASPAPITSLSHPNPPPQGTGPGWWTSNYGGWHLCEWYLKQESPPGSGNGIFQSWFDGTLINYWNNINFNQATGGVNAFNIANFIPYYGGGGSAAPANEYICVGRFMIAGA